MIDCVNKFFFKFFFNFNYHKMFCLGLIDYINNQELNVCNMTLDGTPWWGLKRKSLCPKKSDLI